MYNKQAFDDVPRILSESGRDLVRFRVNMFVMNSELTPLLLCRVMQVGLHLSNSLRFSVVSIPSPF